jgi:hypothetical protein
MRVSYKKFDSARNFGVELEVGNEISRSAISSVIKNTTKMKVSIANYSQSVNNSNWVVKTDASCGKKVRSNGMNEGGYEIASFVASGIEDAEKIARVAASLKRRKVRANDNCGYHIHVNVSDFLEEQVGNLVGYWVMIEDILFSAVPFRRTVNKYCKKVKLKKISFDGIIESLNTGKKLWEHFRPKVLNLRSPTEKRYSLNLLNYFVASRTKFKRKTIEFRFPEGTLSRETVKNFILLLVNFVENVKNMPTPIVKEKKTIEEALIFLGLSDAKSFCLLDLNLMKVKVWLLKRIVRYSKSIAHKDQAKAILARINRGIGNAKG